MCIRDRSILEPIASVLGTIVGWVSKIVSFGSGVISKIAGLFGGCLLYTSDVYKRQRQGGQELSVAESSLLLYAAVEDLPARRPAGEGLNVCLLYTSRCV